jgi:hypothetical protein
MDVKELREWAAKWADLLLSYENGELRVEAHGNI